MVDIRRLCNPAVLLLVFSLALAGPSIAEETCKPTGSWWSISDAEFFETYSKPCGLSSNQKDRSKFAWMLFARVSQPVEDADGTPFVAWELWASNPETFPSSGEPTFPPTKNRTGPVFTKAKGQITSEGSGGEEVTRNRASFDYITNPNQPLWNVNGLEAVYNQRAHIDDTIGAVEIKARWRTSSSQTAWGTPAPVQENMYQSIPKVGLGGLHIMAKIAPTPSDAFTSPEPSWFWTTFEYYENPGRDDALRFITHKDALTPEEVGELIQDAGLPEKLARYYRCNGTQLTFVDGNTDVVLGNTTMEGGFATGGPPSTWTAWNSSCHSCHGQARVTASGPRARFTPIAGRIPARILGDQPLSMDFLWPIPDQAVQ